MNVPHRVSRTEARLRDPEAGAPKLGGRGRARFNILDLRVPQGRAPRPLEKAGRVGLGYEQTETELFLLLTNFKYATRKNITLFCLQVLLESVHAQCS
jgi:hypothetical protein